MRKPIDPGIFGAISPISMLCKLEYSNAGMRPWRNDDLVRLGYLLNCTPRELLALVGMFNESKMQRHWEADSWPLEICIPLFKLRRFKMGLRSPDIQDRLTARLLTIGNQELHG